MVLHSEGTALIVIDFKDRWQGIIKFDVVLTNRIISALPTKRNNKIHSLFDLSLFMFLP